MTKFGLTLEQQIDKKFKQYYLNYKALKKKIKATRETALNHINTNHSLKTKVERIQEQAKKNVDMAYEEIRLTVIGETQTEFLTMLDKEIERAADFYALKTRQGIKDCNSILNNKDNWL